ncbi:hypothetical protein S40288_10209, partial [Stachybotrys chartarum IBT 40288]
PEFWEEAFRRFIVSRRTTFRIQKSLILALFCSHAILCALCLSAGHTPGFLEDFAIVRLNTSTIGHSLLDFSRDNDENAGNTSNDDNNPLSSISDAWNDVEQEVSNAFDGLANSVIDEAVDLLDIPEWYSLHVMTICEGLNGPDVGLNVTQCSDLTSESTYTDLPLETLSTKLALDRLDLIASLDHYLSLSPVQIDMDIADISWLEDIQDAINLVNGVLQGLFALYILTILLIVLSIVTNVIVSLAWTSMLMVVNLIGFILATLSSVVLSIIVTVALTRAIDALNAIGGNLGIRGERGSNFIILSWMASTLMVCATSFVLVYSRKKNKALEWVMARPNESIGSHEKDSGISIMAGQVRDSVKQIEENSWLIGDKAILHRSLSPVPNYSWKSDDGSFYTLSNTSFPQPQVKPLPSDSIIRQVHDAGDASAVWSLGNAFLKVKLFQDRNQATKENTTLDWLANRKISFDVPKVLYYAEGHDRSYLIVSRIPGETLGAAWRGMKETEKQQCVHYIVDIIKELSNWQSDSITGVDGLQLPESWLDVCREPHDFTPNTLRENCHTLGMDCSKVVFSHNDLGPYNIIVDDQKRITGIIDFEMAGYVPREWIRTKFGVSWALDLEEPGVTSTEWRKQVAQQLGEEGFPEVMNAWKNWFKEYLESREDK